MWSEGRIQEDEDASGTIEIRVRETVRSCVTLFLVRPNVPDPSCTDLDRTCGEALSLNNGNIVQRRGYIINALITEDETYAQVE